MLEKLPQHFSPADIPLYKLRNPDMQSLFQFLGRKAPSESACRKRVDDMEKCEVDRVCEILLNRIIFMVIVESEISGCKYLNTLVGNIEVPETTYLMHCKILCTSPNQLTIVHAVDDAIRTLQANRNNFVLLLTDAARYMTAAGRLVKGIYPKLFHITCTAHALHNAVERIHNHYEDVNKLIATVKASVVKNKDRRGNFSEIGSPSQPIVTRWGSWLNAVKYYAENFPIVCDIVNAFEGTGHQVVSAKEAVAAALFKQPRENLSMLHKVGGGNKTSWKCKIYSLSSLRKGIQVRFWKRSRWSSVVFEPPAWTEQWFESYCKYVKHKCQPSSLC